MQPIILQHASPCIRHLVWTVLNKPAAGIKTVVNIEGLSAMLYLIKAERFNSYLFTKTSFLTYQQTVVYTWTKINMKNQNKKNNKK